MLEYALQHQEIQGLVLFSPAIRSDEPLDFLAPLLASVTGWLCPPRPGQPQQIATRYLHVTTNGFAQFYYSSANVRHLLAKNPYDKPVLMALVRAARLPEWRISQFSHMSVLFSPDNPLYGQTGSLRLCSKAHAPPLPPMTARKV